MGTNPANAAYRACSKNRETTMNIAKIVLAGTAALTISSAALAQQALTGTITAVDRINGTVAIQQPQSGTTGANSSAGTTQEYKTQRGLSLDTLHAGDKVTFFATETGGVKTITKFEQQ
jgi:Cu/Ag efflux protein CusF